MRGFQEGCEQNEIYKAKEKEVQEFLRYLGKAKVQRPWRCKRKNRRNFVRRRIQIECEKTSFFLVEFFLS